MRCSNAEYSGTIEPVHLRNMMGAEFGLDEAFLSVWLSAATVSL